MDPTHELKIEDWRAFCASPGEASFTPVFEATRRLVHAICHRILRDDDDARDAFQSTYCRLLAEAQTSDAAATGEPVRFIRLLAVREADSLLKRRGRRRKRETLLEESSMTPSPNPGAAEHSAQSQLQERLSTLLSGLPDKYRVPVTLHYFQGMTHAEIAEALGRSIHTISSQIARALRQLEPKARRAGLGEALTGLGALGGGATLFAPAGTATASAATVFASAQASLATGTIAAGGAAQGGLLAWLFGSQGGLAVPGAALGVALFISAMFFALKPNPPATPAASPAVTAPVAAPSSARSGPTFNPRPAPVLAAAVSSDPAPAATPARNPDRPAIGLLFSRMSAREAPARLEGGAFLGAHNFMLHDLLVPMFKLMGVDLYAVVEPGTESDAEATRIIQKNRLQEKLINAADPEDLKKVEAVITLFDASTSDEVIESFAQAVRAGMGLASISILGVNKPGNTTAMRDLFGLDLSDAAYRSVDEKMMCPVVAPEEFLLALGAVNELSISQVRGFTGVVEGTQLVVLPEEVDPGFCVAYARELGEGRIFVVQSVMPDDAVPLLRSTVQTMMNYVLKRPLSAQFKGVSLEKIAKMAGGGASEEATPTPPTGGRPPRLGILLSPEYNRPFAPSATDGGTVMGFSMGDMGVFLLQLGLSGWELYPVMEPGAAEDDKILRFMASVNFKDRRMDAGDAEALDELDLLLTNHNQGIQDATLTAVDAAVRGGLGLLVGNPLTARTPEGSALLQGLLGLAPTMENAIYQGETYYEAQVVENPLTTAGLLDAGRRIQFVRAAGYRGQPEGGIPMVGPVAELPQDFVLCYLRQLEQGKIAVLQAGSVGVNDFDTMLATFSWAGRPAQPAQPTQ